MAMKIINRWIDPNTTGPAAGGWQFFCPGCDSAHTINDSWGFNGDETKPTFTPSILLKKHDNTVCHSFVNDGQIRFLNDCTHKLKGQTVPIPAWPYDDNGQKEGT